MNSVAVIANPTAGAPAFRLSGEAAARLLRAHGFRVSIYTSSRAGEAEELAARAAEKFPVVAAVGGDGTIHEVARGLLGSSAALAILPSGSGNDFALGLGITSPAEGAAAAGRRQSRRLDVAYLNEHPFFNSAGFFLSGRVSHLARGLPRVFGRLRYRLAALRAILSYRCQSASWHLRGTDTECDGRWLLAEVGNGPSAGGGFMLTPDADPGDGVLDFCLVRPLPMLTLLRLFPAASRGERLEHPGVYRLQAKSATLEIERSVPVHLDGEVMFLPKGVHRLSLQHGQLAVLTPPRAKYSGLGPKEEG